MKRHLGFLKIYGVYSAYILSEKRTNLICISNVEKVS